MIPMNEAYGNAASLRQYCGVSHSAPIWGEIQHSLWLNNLNKAHERRSRLFPRLFTWNTFLNYENSIPIGDPMSYFVGLNQPKEVKIRNEVVLLPKFRRAVNLEERIKQYRGFMIEAFQKWPNANFVLSIHPEEHSHLDRIISDRFLGVRIHETIEKSNPMAEYVELFKSSNFIFTDYLGAHVFRAKSYFDVNTEFASETWENSKIDSQINSLFQDFVTNKGNAEAKRVSDLLLGLEHKKSPIELSELLGFSKTHIFFGKLIHKGYIKYSQRIKTSS
jgi:hypothetical protein